MSKVYFFATCVGSVAYADTCVNAIKLLQNEGVEVIFKKNQTCCGQPSYNSGYYDESRNIAKYNLDLFDKDYPIIIPSGSCTGMMRVDYKHLFKEQADEKLSFKIDNFTNRVFELSEYLDKVLNVKYQDKGEKIKITWHSNCHALRVSKCIPSAKKLLRSLANVELIELEREEECCGFGGTFSIKEPEISKAMVTAKIADIKSRQVDCLISADAGCLMNISGAIAKQNENIMSMHLYDFLVQRLGL